MATTSVDAWDDGAGRSERVAFGIDMVGPPIRFPIGEDHPDEADRYLGRIARQCERQFASTDMLTEFGDPAHVIAEAARREAVDVVVMATHGRTGLERLTMGSVATRVLQRAPSPVMLVRPAALSTVSDEAR